MIRSRQILALVTIPWLSAAVAAPAAAGVPAPAPASTALPPAPAVPPTSPTGTMAPLGISTGGWRGEFRDAAKWFAKRGYLVVAPVGTGYGAAAIDIPEHGLYGPFFSKVGKCSNPNFRAPGLAVAQVDLWIIDYMTAEKRIVPKDVIVVGQSAGGWASIALSSLNPPQVKAIITFAAGRGGRVDGKPNNNCAPDKLVEATGEFGRTSRVPMLWIYIENDTFFGAALSKRMHEAFTAAGGKAEYHLVPPFGNDGHFFIGSPDAIPIWSPLVTKFLDEQG